jgi:hypothetical protein
MKDLQESESENTGSHLLTTSGSVNLAVYIALRVVKNQSTGDINHCYGWRRDPWRRSNDSAYDIKPALAFIVTQPMGLVQAA